MCTIMDEEDNNLKFLQDEGGQSYFTKVKYFIFKTCSELFEERQLFVEFPVAILDLIQGFFLNFARYFPSVLSSHALL